MRSNIFASILALLGIMQLYMTTAFLTGPLKVHLPELLEKNITAFNVNVKGKIFISNPTKWSSRILKFASWENTVAPFSYANYALEGKFPLPYSSGVMYGPRTQLVPRFGSKYFMMTTAHLEGGSAALFGHYTLFDERLLEFTRITNQQPTGYESHRIGYTVVTECAGLPYIYVVGGENVAGNSRFNKIFRFDVTKQGWDNIPMSIHAGGSALFWGSSGACSSSQRLLWYLGGIRGNGERDSRFFDFPLEDNPTVPIVVTPRSEPGTLRRKQHMAYSEELKLLVAFGGQGASNYYDDWRFTSTASAPSYTWTTATTKMITQKGNPEKWVHNNRLYVFGGFYPSASPYLQYLPLVNLSASTQWQTLAWTNPTTSVSNGFTMQLSDDVYYFTRDSASMYLVVVPEI